MGGLVKSKPKTQPAKAVVKPKPVVNPREPIREAGKDDDDPKRRRGRGGGGAAASGTILSRSDAIDAMFRSRQINPKTLLGD